MSTCIIFNKCEPIYVHVIIAKYTCIYNFKLRVYVLCNKDHKQFVCCNLSFTLYLKIQLIRTKIIDVVYSGFVRSQIWIVKKFNFMSKIVFKYKKDL